MFSKSALRESASTEGLRLDDSPPRSRMEQDIEFGELDTGKGDGPGGGGPRRYSVSVVAGWEPQSVNDLVGGADSGRRGPGIQTTTVVSQQVSFSSPPKGGLGGRSSDDKRAL
jgi:hypothetical protein